MAGATERIFRAVAAVFTAVGADPPFGSWLPATLADAGLANVGAEIHTPVVAGGAESWSRGTVEQLAARLVETGLVTAADIEAFLTVTAQPSTYYVPPLMVSAWGRRPLA